MTLAARSANIVGMMRLLALALALSLGIEALARADASPPPASTDAVSQPGALYDRLAQAKDADEAAGIVAALERLRSHSGSDTADLLMSRAVQATNARNYPLALSLLDATVHLDPDWVEAWNQRATVRYYAGDAAGSMADIAQTLKREPRHLGALAGMGAILEDAGRLEDAKRAYDRALAIAPRYEPIRDAATRLKAKLAGRSL